MKNNILEILKNYIYERFKVFILIICCFLILWFVFLLYNIKIELEAIIYSMILVLVFLIFVSIFDFKIYYTKHNNLINISNEIVNTIDNLPKVINFSDKVYKVLIKKLFKEKNKLYVKFENEKNDIQDYFTLWVHQVKLPISAIKLIIETENNIDKKLLKSELFRIEQYSNMVLAYLRINSIYLDYVIKKYCLDNIVRQAIRNFSNEFIRKKIKLDFKETNFEVITDEKWLLFVIEQLISNALKYTNEGTIYIYCNEKNELIIEDTGIGIDTSDLKRVFEKGYTGINGRIDKKSTGLGLYLCKNILENLSHKINIQSELNKGTKIILNLNQNDLLIK